MDEERRAGGLEATFLDNRGVLLRFLRARGAGDAAEDLLQELWLKAVGRPAEPISQPLAYLYRMANNLMLDQRRSEHRARRRERDWSDEAMPEPSASHGPSGERMLLAQEELRAVQQALAELGERTETIFRRFRLDGVAQHRIAEEMGISLSAVEKHLQKAYRALLALRDHDDAD